MSELDLGPVDDQNSELDLGAIGDTINPNAGVIKASYKSPFNDSDFALQQAGVPANDPNTNLFQNHDLLKNTLVDFAAGGLRGATAPIRGMHQYVKGKSLADIINPNDQDEKINAAIAKLKTGASVPGAESLGELVAPTFEYGVAMNGLDKLHNFVKPFAPELKDTAGAIAKNLPDVIQRGMQGIEKFGLTKVGEAIKSLGEFTNKASVIGAKNAGASTITDIINNPSEANNPDIEHNAKLAAMLGVVTHGLLTPFRHTPFEHDVPEVQALIDKYKDKYNIAPGLTSDDVEMRDLASERENNKVLKDKAFKTYNRANDVQFTKDITKNATLDGKPMPVLRDDYLENNRKKLGDEIDRVGLTATPKFGTQYDDQIQALRNDIAQGYQTAKDGGKHALAVFDNYADRMKKLDKLNPGGTTTNNVRGQNFVKLNQNMQTDLNSKLINEYGPGTELHNGVKGLQQIMHDAADKTLDPAELKLSDLNRKYAVTKDIQDFRKQSPNHSFIRPSDLSDETIAAHPDLKELHVLESRITPEGGTLGQRNQTLSETKQMAEPHTEQTMQEKVPGWIRRQILLYNAANKHYNIPTFKQKLLPAASLQNVIMGHQAADPNSIYHKLSKQDN